MEHAILGRVSPDPLGAMVEEMFDTKRSVPFLKFRNDGLGISGLAREREGGLEVLAVNAEKPGTGQFRAFITRAKAIYPKITLIEVWNETLDRTLERYGFKTVVVEESDGEILRGRLWIRP